MFKIAEDGVVITYVKAEMDSLICPWDNGPPIRKEKNGFRKNLVKYLFM